MYFLKDNVFKGIVLEIQLTSHTMCSAANLSLVLNLWTGDDVFLQIGHLVMSSGHSYGATEAGASQYL